MRPFLKQIVPPEPGTRSVSVPVLFPIASSWSTSGRLASLRLPRIAISAQLLDDPIRYVGPREHELRRIDGLRAVAERARNAKAAHARFERRLNVCKERLELAVVPFTFLWPTLPLARSHCQAPSPSALLSAPTGERAER
jgi:hypothetical protein